MPIKGSVKGGSDFEPIPAGSYHAVCYSVVDLGTQPSTLYAPSRKVLIQWEIPSERIEYERDGKQVNLPRATSQQFTLSMHPKGNLRKFLESWRGVPFTDEQAGDFDIAKLVGANCILNIIHKAGTGQNAGKVYANVSSVSPLMKGMERKGLENPSLTFSLDDFNGVPITFPKGMPEWVQKKICESEEFLSRTKKANQADEEPDVSFETASPVKGRATDDGSAFGSTNRGEADVPF